MKFEEMQSAAATKSRAPHGARGLKSLDILHKSVYNGVAPRTGRVG